MIEYLNAIATVLVLLTTVFSLLRTNSSIFETIKDGIGVCNDVSGFLKDLPKWIHFYNNLKANVQILQQKRDRLQQRRDDMTIRVENEEFQTGRCRRREVDNWLRSANDKCDEVHLLLQATEREANYFFKFLHQAWLGNFVERKIQEVDDVYNSGQFEDVLSCVIDRLEYITPSLAGKTANEDIKRIREWLRNGVTKIGVHGIEGIGKSAIVIHIYNQLLSDDVQVYMIQVLENYREYDLQAEIARALGVDLQEDSELRRAALLHRALQRRNFVLILDGLTKYISEDKIGIPLNATRGKMIVTSRSPDVCRKTGCQNNMIAMDPLSFNEALMLFKEKVDLELEPQIENLARQIVKQCRGVPLKIVNKANDLRGVDDINDWKKNLKDMFVANA